MIDAKYTNVVYKNFDCASNDVKNLLNFIQKYEMTCGLI
jgi:hypothetical protein